MILTVSNLLVILKFLLRSGLKEDPLKEGVHPYLSVRLNSEWKAEDVLHFSLKIPMAALT